MRRRITYRFVLATAIVGLLGFLLIATLGSRMIYSGILRATSRRLYAEATQITAARGTQRITDEESLNDSLDNLRAVATYEGAEIWFIGETGEILLNTNANGASGMLANFDPIALGSSYYTVGRFFGAFDGDRLSVMMPLSNEMRIRGYIAIHVPVTELIAQREEMLHIILLIYLIVFLLLMAIVIYLTVSFGRPLSRILRGVREFSAGNLTYSIDVDRQDELGELASSLNYMSDELSKTGEAQKSFIANVSHDFRSPLTSIKGYVEAIQDGTIPPELQGKYLDIVRNETERLEKLTSGILTLNDINDKAALLEYGRFDINRVVKETAALFEGTCTAREITIELILDGEERFVNADLGKIQQVLYNLLDNAIKFSRDASAIEIETSTRHEKVYVSVKDHGIGIPSEKLGKIWERFYKIDTSRGKDTKGTGLGLAIVRDIIQMHGQNINVVSTEGAGTEFIFSLDPA